jgi:hypothetical protein
MTLRLPDHWVWNAWYGLDGRFLGGLSDPIPVEVGPDGGLRLVEAPGRIGGAGREG